MTEQDRLFAEYQEYVLQNGRRPASLAAFLKTNQGEGILPFTSFVIWEQAEMRDIFLKARNLLRQDEAFASYSARERVLAMFYTWFELLGQQREFLLKIEKIQSWSKTATLWDKVKPIFLEWLGEIIDDGVESGEIANRLFVPQWYRNIVWAQAMVILSNWLYDRSTDLSKTDAWIEKSVNFIFDFIQPNALDSGWDLVKFIVQK